MIVVAAALQISYLQQQFYGRLWGDIDVITIIGSIMIHQISLQDLRGEDPNAQFYWITFVISDMYVLLFIIIAFLNQIPKVHFTVLFAAFHWFTVL